MIATTNTKVKKRRQARIEVPMEKRDEWDLKLLKLKRSRGLTIEDMMDWTNLTRQTIWNAQSGLATQDVMDRIDQYILTQEGFKKKGLLPKTNKK